MNSLTAAQAIAVYRARYPEGLVCLACGRLLTTDRRRFPRLTDAEASAYVCAECRWEAAEAARVAASKSERGRNAALARQAKTVTQMPSEAGPGEEYVPEQAGERGARTIAGLHSELSDAESRKAFPSRRKRGRKPAGPSRQARYRRRHPERAAADLRRLRTGVGA
jgi:hypothetical protein